MQILHKFFPILKNFSTDYKGKVDWTDPWRKHVQLHLYEKTIRFNRAVPTYPQDEFTHFFSVIRWKSYFCWSVCDLSIYTHFFSQK